MPHPQLQRSASLYSLPRSVGGSVKPSKEQNLDEEEDEEEDEDDTIEWTNIIFLPFYFWWELLMTIIVCMKCIYAPLSALYPSSLCHSNLHTFVGHMKFVYTYVGDTFYVIDVVLHIVHRQVSDVAKKKEYLPKQACLIFFDILSLVPFFNLIAGHSCEQLKDLMGVWPNILMFSELICVYRVAQFFMSSTHSYFKLMTGFLLMVLIMINATTCLFLLMTYGGLCENCGTGVYDWRGYELSVIKNGDKNNTLQVHLFALTIVTSRFVNINSVSAIPRTYIEFISDLVIIGIIYFLRIFIVHPKLFSESVYRFKRMFSFHLRVKRIIAETKRRDPSSRDHLTVQQFYRLSWTKQNGINTMPQKINDLPLTLKTNIYMDLTWPVFYHSPILRKTSLSYKRWLSDKIVLHRKLPHERFFEGPHCYTDLHYLKSGIVQIISAEDSKAPMMSFTSGTLLGDISFYVPPKNRKVIVRCLTYCEIFTVSRAHIVMSLHKFPEDSRNIMIAARGKVKHGRDLFACKKAIRGLDRSEDEGIAYIKRRWWLINETVQRWKISSKPNKKKCDIPAEDEPYHCSKYIGQLVLCSISKMRLMSVFTKESFPWILASHSNFAFYWNRFILVVVFIALITLPPFLTRQPTHNSLLFRYFLMVIDIIYTTDVVISLITVKAGFEHETRIKKVMLERCYSKYFTLDVLSMFWVEYVVYIFFSHQKYHITARYCRLIKTYILFCDNHRYKKYWNKDHNLLKRILFKAAMLYVCSFYVLPYVFYWYIRHTKGLNVVHTYGNNCLDGDTCASVEKRNEELAKFGVLSLALGYWFSGLLPVSFQNADKSEIYDYVFTAVIDIIYQLFLFLFLNGICTAALYLYYKKRVKYQVMATKIRRYYRHIKIHPLLMKRLDRYLKFHWKYYNGTDILYTALLQNEPYEIAWKLYDGVADKLIRESKAFKGADPKLVTELARRSTFKMYPLGCIIIMFGITVEDVTWLASGVVMYEYQNENNETVKRIVSSGEILSPSALFFELPSHVTCFAATDCEIIYINRKGFFETLKKYPDEWYIFQTVIEEFSSSFHDLAIDTFENENLRNEMRAQLVEISFNISSNKDIKQNKVSTLIQYFKEFRTNPESNIIFHWRAFMALIVVVSIFSTALQCAGNATTYNNLENVKLFCDLCYSMDIIIKFMVPYYDQRGLVISKITKCSKHYLTRGFCVDFVGVVCAHISLLKIFMTYWSFNRFKKFEMLMKYSHLYLLTGFFDYCADVPLSTAIIITILKWQFILILTALGLAVYLVNICINYHMDENYDIIKLSMHDKFCWVSKVFVFNKNNPTLEQTNLLYMAALEYVETLFGNEFIGHFEEFDSKTMVALLSLFSSVVYRGFYYSCLVLLVLKYQTNYSSRDKIDQLSKFLKAERVDTPLIEKTIDYFMYNLRRTQGVNITGLLKERVGSVFRHDLNYYFHKKTFRTANSLLGGGKTLERRLASNTKVNFFLPGEDIIREMDLSEYVYFVHRGKVVVLKEGKELASLTKGSMFGLLDDDKPRAARTTVRSVDHADMLQITIAQFQHFITDTVGKNIMDNPQSKLDYLAVKDPVSEGPYNSIAYILRGVKTIKIPYIMKESVTPETSKWYEWWLLVVWVLNPAFNNILSFATFSIPNHARNLFFVKVIMYNVLLPGCDILHILFMVSEFFTLETVVIENKCVQKYITWKQFKNWERYLDLASLTSSVVAYLTWKPRFGWARVLRLYYIYKFSVEMSKTSKLRNKSRPTLLICMVVLLLITLVTCVWKYFTCFRGDMTVAPLFPEGFNLDKSEWQHPLSRKKSCKVIRGVNNETKEVIFAIAEDWRMDYVISLLYGMIIFVGFDDNFAMPLSFEQVTAKVLLWYFLELVSICLVSSAINAVYTKSLRKYQFDYQMATLIKYMKRNGISKFLQHLAGNYAERFWQRTADDWVPEITHEAPLCLREDIFGALYMHHLLRPALFHKLPHYVLRQLVVRLQRTVIFPGQWIVKQGDAVSVIYFIHEGEVEKWHTNASGNTRLITVLPSNSYFGLIPGLFPNTTFAFSYFSRTIVDCMYLEYNKWIDLINNYPELKQEFYLEAKNVKM